MGVFSEMDMEQYENGGTEPFQLDSYMVPATELSGRPDPPKQSPMNTPTPPAKVTAENKMVMFLRQIPARIWKRQKARCLPQAKMQHRSRRRMPSKKRSSRLLK